MNDSANDSASLSASETEAEAGGNFLAQQIIGVIITGFVIFLGLAGNAVSFVLLSKTRRSSMIIILRTLLISDSIVLFFYFVSQILPNLHELIDGLFFIHVHKIHGYLLRFAWPLVMTAQMTSVWLTVLISVERWFAVCRPLTVGASLTTQRTTKSVICISLIALLYNIPRFFEYRLCVMWDSFAKDVGDNNHNNSSAIVIDSENQNCSTSPIENNDCMETCLSEACQSMGPTWIFVVKSEFGASSSYNTLYCAVLYSLTTFLVPILLIGPLNTMIIVRLRQSNKQRPSLTRRQRNEERITLLPIWIVGLFCVCSMPSTLVNIAEAAMSVDSSVMDVAMPITNLLVTLNSAINCIVYCAFTRKFRVICLQVFCRREEKRVFKSLRSAIHAEVFEQHAICSIAVDEVKRNQIVRDTSIAIPRSYSDLRTSKDINISAAACALALACSEHEGRTSV